MKMEYLRLRFWFITDKREMELLDKKGLEGWGLCAVNDMGILTIYYFIRVIR